MILAIRSDSAEATIILADDDGEVIIQETWLAGRRLSQELLPKMKQLLENNSSSWNDITGLVAFEGPGSFTGLRIGLTTANAVAYSRQVPVVAAGGEDWLVDGASLIANGEGEQIALPVYGAEPNITRPKR
ncbi:MAG TPA: tRNA (adenosine(37)-N6)-threonylcarbamoyltransferase complex dimerization subunit type 1 TsaB [Candidatus Nanoarchaeia archaeon]|nr:tRNA (adenosine(37)-N6)-threonylcarbamoyltransferase complex dimerization subunit type 1 TsaB [Candidatus Nanoarchaeia archaeon]